MFYTVRYITELEKVDTTLFETVLQEARPENLNLKQLNARCKEKLIAAPTKHIAAELKQQYKLLP